VFRERVREFSRLHRRDLPWRRTTDPYRILVSEVMLQQTPVGRVLRMYGPFIDRFPGIGALAAAPLSEVLAAWKGLGYNRRAVLLSAAAKAIAAAGRFPESEEELRRLPGIGRATAASIVVFAFNRPVVFIETNIRRVFIHCYCEGRAGIHDREILPHVARTLDREAPREWYYALMDLGTYLGRTYGNPNRRSAHYQRQAPFPGSDREIRGRVLGILLHGPREVPDLARELAEDPARIGRIVLVLEKDGLVRDGNGRVSIA
jgi:A/G-specific adenine glycosylase